MKQTEKIQFLVGGFILIAFPLPFLILGAQWAMLLLTVVGLSAWLVNMQVNVCARCVNFSCPANRVPKKVVDAYLKLNPIMLKAWKENGYQIG